MKLLSAIILSMIFIILGGVLIGSIIWFILFKVLYVLAGINIWCKGFVLLILTILASMCIFKYVIGWVRDWISED